MLEKLDELRGVKLFEGLVLSHFKSIQQLLLAAIEVEASNRGSFTWSWGL